MSSLPPAEKKALLQQVADDAKGHFDADRDAVLDMLPPFFKTVFNQIGFGRWGTKHFPVLVLSPYSIPPGDVRELWLQKFDIVGCKMRVASLLNGPISPR